VDVQYIYARVEVSVAYDSNLDHVYRVVEKVGQQLQEDEQDVLEPTRVAGIEHFGKNNLLLLTLTKVKPGKHLHIRVSFVSYLRILLAKKKLRFTVFLKIKMYLIIKRSLKNCN
jgi:moderate conductance mechanosensitive channel